MRCSFSISVGGEARDFFLLPKGSTKLITDISHKKSTIVTSEQNLETMKVSSACIFVSFAATASAFSPISSKVRVVSPLTEKNTEVASFDPLNLSSEETNDFDFKPAMASLAAMAALAPDANAAGPDWGIFEGRTGSLLHPVIMGGTFLFSLSTALLGFQYRRQRTMGDEISGLKKTLPNLGGAGTLSAAIAQAEEAEDSSLAAQLKGALPIQAEIDALTAERKDLASKKLKDSHFSQGTLLAFVGTSFAIEVRSLYLKILSTLSCLIKSQH